MYLTISKKKKPCIGFRYFKNITFIISLILKNDCLFISDN